MPDVIIRANFGMEKLRGLGNTGGQSLGSPIETMVTLTTVLHYRTACDASLGARQGHYITYWIALRYIKNIFILPLLSRIVC